MIEAWISLMGASICETLWASSLKFLSTDRMKDSYKNEGLFSTRFLLSLLPFITYVFFGISNMILLTYALKFIPLAICYAVWMGLALLIQTIIDIFIFKENISIKQIGFLILLMIGIIGLQTSFQKAE